MRRKLSAVERMIDGNIVYVATLAGSLELDRLRLALSSVQRKHPAMRVLIREERDGLYYEQDCAPEIPLRIVPRVTECDYRRECQIELTTPLARDQPQLRVAWLRSENESDIVFTTSHRICDGMSMLTIVRETLRLLYLDEELIPYTPITTRDMIGDYQPQQPWKCEMKAHLLNGLLRMIPPSRREPENREYALEWRLDRSLTDTLKQRCKAEGVSIHAALVAALDRALFAELGEKKTPAWIECPMDARRGRLANLKSDMLFFGGGSFKISTGEQLKEEFWTRARSINEEIRQKVEKEMLDIPGRYYFNELLRPLPSGRIQSIIRMADRLKINGSWNRFALSNLGNIVIGDDRAPIRLKDLRIYIHSFNFRLLGLVAYALNGEIRFYYVGDEKCFSRHQARALKQAFTALIEQQVLGAERRAESPFEWASIAG
ncbi:MAG TPA: condensation domain-containing protein [Silvibacterium sp.]|nr:condensation domain-containing protein [Silvibacterium sp.]